MNPKDNSNEELLDNLEEDENSSSVDDFIKELEEKEKDLDISSDLVIEVDESDVEHENIHNSFVSNKSLEPRAFSSASNYSQEDIKADSEYAELQEKVSKLTEERDELKDSIQRRQRDFDNYRNRTERERKETFKNILSSLATQMLPVLDNLNRALDSATSAEEDLDKKDFRTFLEGIVLVNQQLNEVLIGMGVEPIPSVGEPFDPAFHEAVATEETDEHPHKTVIQELLRGYKIDDRIIRASMVKVSSSTNFQPSVAIELD